MSQDWTSSADFVVDPVGNLDTTDATSGGSGTVSSPDIHELERQQRHADSVEHVQPEAPRVSDVHELDRQQRHADSVSHVQPSVPSRPDVHQIDRQQRHADSVAHIDTSTRSERQTVDAVGGRSFGIPGTSYEFTTSPSEADVVSTDDVADRVSDTGARVSDAVGAGTDRVRDTGSQVRDRASDARSAAVERGTDTVETVHSGLDDRVRDATDDRVGISDDWTSTDDSGGVRGVADEMVREVTGDRVGISDDFTTTDDTIGEGAFGIDGISPGAGMSITDPEAIEARAEQEQRIIGWTDIDDVSDVPGAAVGATFGVGQAVERAGVGTGERLSAAIPSAEIGPQVGEEHVGEVPANLVGGSVAFAGMGAGAALQLPGSAIADVQDMRDGEETPTEAQGGNIDLARSFGETQLDMATDYPMSTAAGFSLPTASGVPAGVRGVRATRGTEGRVRWDQITDDSGATGDLPHFDTPPSAPTSRAISELEGRMADQPQQIRDLTDGEGALFHSTGQPFGTRRFEVGEGASEFPGLFTSPEASPLGLRERGVSRPSDDGGLTFGFGDFSMQPEAVPGFQVRGLEGIPQRAAEPGYAVRDSQGNVMETGLSRGEANRIADETGGDRVPDPTTRGYDFLTEDAPTETGMVRPPGDRTTEMEAVLPPDSQFVRSGAVGVEMPDGRTIRSDIFRPDGEPVRGPDAPARADGDGPVDGSMTASDISSTAGGVTRQPDVTVESVFGTTAAVGDPSPTGTATPSATTPDSSGMGTGVFDGMVSEPGFTDPVETEAGTATSESGTATSPTTTGTTPFGEATSTAPSDPFTDDPTSTAPTTPSEDPTVSTPPAEPTSFSPFEPTRGGSETSPTAPAGGPTGPFAFPSEPITQQDERRWRRRSGDESDEWEPIAGEDLAPETTEWTNPIASGTDWLEGGGSVGELIEDSQREPDAQAGIFGEW